MNEGAPKNNSENVENLSDWRELKEQAPVKASELISEVSGYEDMSVSEKIVAIDGILAVLNGSKEKFENDNRYIIREVAHEAALLEETRRHQEAMGKLGVAEAA